MQIPWLTALHRLPIDILSQCLISARCLAEQHYQLKCEDQRCYSAILRAFGVMAEVHCSLKGTQEACSVRGQTWNVHDELLEGPAASTASNTEQWTGQLWLPLLHGQLVRHLVTWGLPVVV